MVFPNRGLNSSRMGYSPGMRGGKERDKGSNEGIGLEEVGGGREMGGRWASGVKFFIVDTFTTELGFWFSLLNWAVFNSVIFLLFGLDLML